MDKHPLTSGDVAAVFMRIGLMGFVVGWLTGAAAIGLIWWMHA